MKREGRTSNGERSEQVSGDGPRERDRASPDQAGNETSERPAPTDKPKPVANAVVVPPQLVHHRATIMNGRDISGDGHPPAGASRAITKIGVFVSQEVGLIELE